MSLEIDRLNLTLPASLGHRKHAISRLLRTELQNLPWPDGFSAARLQVPALQLSSRHSNLHIAAAIARQIHRSTVQQHAATEGGQP